MSFLDSEYLLESDIARDIFESIESLPIYDPHSHVDVQEILDNEGWNDIWEVEAETDHYVWELMRKRGIEEEKITGGASNKEKWMALASIFPSFAGNPTYEWVHLDLKGRFDIDAIISDETADLIWNKTASKLNKDSFAPQQLLQDMNVSTLCSTDDPTTELSQHKECRRELKNVEILPTWRPDRFIKIEDDSWSDDVKGLGEDSSEDVSSFQGYLDALNETHRHFDEMGCLASDHGIERAITRPVSMDRAVEIYEKRFLRTEEVSEEEIIDFKSFMLTWFGRLNGETNWVTQLHIGAVRNYRDKLYETVGPDSGGDVGSQNVNLTSNLRYFLNKFDGKMDIVLYYLDPTHLPMVATLARAFPNVSVGAPWWFNDSPYGIEDQLEYLGTVDLLANHAGMVSDSRKLVSYGSRMEVFRRSLANYLSNMVNRGQIPKDIVYQLANDVVYTRKKELFGFS